MTLIKDAFDVAGRVVVKVGSSLLIDAKGGINDDWLRALAEDIVSLKSNGVDTIVVSSGAVAVGRRRLGLSTGLRLEQKQAASAVGQTHLMNAWREAFEATKLAPQVGQILLTQSDTRDRRRYLNARGAIDALLDIGTMPIVNENDTVATAEIRYGDNDRLAAHTAEIAGADLLVILSDVNGLYTANPSTDAGAAFLPVIDKITPDIEAMASGTSKEAGEGSGGMATKITAAKIAAASGCSTIIAPGTEDNPLSTLLAGGPGTFIRAGQSREAARKVWIRNLQDAAGVVTVDEGAAAAITSGASLLPAGILSIDGDFRRGDLVTICTPTGSVGRGLVAYDAPELARILGKKSDEAAQILGYRRRSAVVERNDLVVG